MIAIWRLWRVSLCLVLTMFLFTCNEADLEADGDGLTMTQDHGTLAIDDTASSNLISLSFASSHDEFLNPERGYYTGVDLMSPEGATTIRERGYSLAIALVRLDAYRTSELEPSFLAQLEQGLAAVREAGIKVILRFTYNSSQSSDADKMQILEHISQLQTLLAANQDVIAVLQAGFIGAWGEWHGSTNGLDNDADRSEILTALLDALPESRSVQIRTPMYKAAALPGGPVLAFEAFSLSARSRVGHHNDCFLASSSDYGTFATPVSEWESFVAQDTRFTPMGGETCTVYEPKIACPVALAYLSEQHWSYLNSDYNTDVLDRWVVDNCQPEIQRRLGYRLVLDGASHSAETAPGGVLRVSMELHNEGFAAPFNARPMYLVLTGMGQRRVVRIAAADPRRWEPGEDVVLSTKLRIPIDVEPGRYSLAIWLPDEEATLANDPRYAVRLANTGVWVPESGENVLTRDLVISSDAPGSTDEGASELRELP